MMIINIFIRITITLQINNISAAIPFGAKSNGNV